MTLDNINMEAEKQYVDRGLK